MNFDKFLQESEVIDFSHSTIQELSQELAKDCKNDEQITKNCFIYVRDNINHSGDFKDDITS